MIVNEEQLLSYTNPHPYIKHKNAYHTERFVYIISFLTTIGFSMAKGEFLYTACKKTLRI